jgi:sn-glycerol 3-phosphate transport system substrate-binding protein
MLFSRRLALGLTIAGALVFPAFAEGPTEIDLFFPVPVDGKLARDMGTMIKEFNETHPDIKTTAVYTGSYDDTLIKTRAAIKAGKPPAAVIMSANSSWTCRSKMSSPISIR